MYRRMTLLASAVAMTNAGTTLAQSDTASLGEIVVTASGFEQNISDAPAMTVPRVPRTVIAGRAGQH